MGSCLSKSTPQETSKHSVKPHWSAATTNVLPGCEALRLLGEGTFGTVVLVRERATSQLFAVKVMNKSQLRSEGQLDSVVTERQVLREAGPHPFVVECHSGFQTTDAVVLVLEYVPGGDMYDLMKKHGCLTEQQAQFYLAEITIAIAELHRHDFVFRDLKLENILVDEEGHIRLTDFGLAGKFLSGEASEQAIFDISGTAIYQAPEMIAGNGHGRVVDWWALGVLAYVLLSGRPPFSSTSREELHDKIQNHTVDLANDERLQDVSSTCQQFISQLLDKNPATRLGCAGSDAADVQRHPFFDGIDWEALLRSEVAPPLEPALEPPPEIGTAANQQEVRHAELKLADKVYSKHKPIRGLSRRISQTKHLDAVEYKHVQVGNGSKQNRISIGLDFQGKNATAAGKTWTDTEDDFGRFIGR